MKSIVKKNIVDILDHSLILHKHSENEKIETLRSMYEKIFVFDFQPTCENIVLYIASVLEKKIPEKVNLFSIKLYETATSYAEWYASDNK